MYKEFETRTSIWATLMSKKITPNNKRLFELIKDKKIIDLYKKIVHFRNNPPDYEVHNLNLDKDYISIQFIHPIICLSASSAKCHIAQEEYYIIFLYGVIPIVYHSIVHFLN